MKILLAGQVVKWDSRENNGGLKMPAITAPQMFNSNVVKLARPCIFANYFPSDTEDDTLERPQRHHCLSSITGTVLKAKSKSPPLFQHVDNLLTKADLICCCKQMTFHLLGFSDPFSSRFEHRQSLANATSLTPL